MTPLKTPLDVHGVHTADEYRAAHRQFVARFRKRPVIATVNPDVKVDSGALRVKCACGNYPIVDPDWRLACCYECGLVYENLTISEVEG